MNFFYSFGHTNTNNKLAGTWRSIEFAARDAVNGKWSYPYGQHPKGFFTYTKTGIVNLNISSEVPLRLLEDSAKNYIVNLLDYINYTALGYFGI